MVIRILDHRVGRQMYEQLRRRRKEKKKEEEEVEGREERERHQAQAQEHYRTGNHTKALDLNINHRTTAHE